MPNKTKRELLEEIKHLQNRIDELTNAVMEKSEDQNKVLGQDFRSIADNTPIMLGISDNTGSPIFFNKSWLDFRGKTLYEEINCGLFPGTHPSDKQTCLNIFNESINKRKEFKVEYRLLRYDNVYRWILGYGIPRWQSDGKFIGYTSSCIDITDYKILEENLNEAMGKYQTVADFTYNWEYWINPEGKFVYVSPSCKRITGYDPEDFIKDADLLFKIIHPDDKELFKNHDLNVLSGSGKNDVLDFRIISNTGEEKWVSHCCQSIFSKEGDYLGRRGSNKDITDRKLAEAKLKESEFHLSEAQKIAKIGSFEFSLDGKEVKWSSETFRIFDRDPALKELAEEEFLQIVHPDDRESLHHNMKNYFLKNKDIDFEYRIILPGNSVKYIYSIGHPVKDNEGKIQKIIGTIADITDRKLPEINFKLSEARLAEAQRIAHLGNWEWDVVNNKVYWSDEVYNIAGLNNSQYGRSLESLFSIIHTHDYEIVQKELNMALEGAINPNIDFRIILPDNSIKFVHIEGEVTFEKDIPVKMVGIIQDITKLKKIEIENENYRKHLELLVEQRTSELKELNIKLEQEVTERRVIAESLSWELQVNEAIANLSSLLLSKQSITIEEISNLVLESSKNLTRSKFGFVGFIDPNTGFFNVPTLTSDIFPTHKVKDKHIIFKEFKGLWGWVLNNHKPIITNDVLHDSRSTGIPEGHISIKRFISAPAIYGSELLGQISLANSESDYSEKDLELLVRLASFFAIIIKSKRMLDALQESERFLQSTLDALPAHIAILDNKGAIIAVNKSWKIFADNNKFAGSNYGIGINYLDVCTTAEGEFSKEAKDVCSGIKSVLYNQCEKFEFEYPCHGNEEKRWFLLKVNRFQGEGGIKLVVSHENVTKRKESEQKIKSQNTFLRNILRSLTYPFFVVDARDFTVKMSNQAAKDLYEGMAEGSSCFSISKESSLCGSHDQTCLIEILKHTKKPIVRERQIKDRQGNIKIFSVHGYPIINLRGEVIQIIEYCFDITERRNAETKLLLQSTALESADNAIVIADYEGRITWVNAAFSLLSGYSFEEVIGNKPNILKSGMHEPEYYIELWETVTSGKVWRNEIINKKKTGEFYTEEMTITPVRGIDDKITHFIAIKQDISDRKKAEKEIKEALEKEKELNELRTRFVSTISHEFRTPLTSILASAELLERYHERWTDEKKIVTLQRIQSSVEYMNEMINDVLTLNKADSGKIEFNPQPLQIVDFCRELIEEVRLAASKNHIIEFNNNCKNVILNLDEKLLRNIISNLLSNAIKYSPNGGKVEFSINLEENTFSIIVKDEGIGIAVEEQNKLFEPFFRGKNISSIPGTGLGLSILKRAVDLHKGVIFFESEPGKGTTFYIKIPLN